MYMYVYVFTHTRTRPLTRVVRAFVRGSQYAQGPRRCDDDDDGDVADDDGAKRALV